MRFKRVLRAHTRAAPSDGGATAVEYAIVLAAIAAVVILTVIALGLSTEGLFSALNNRWQQ
jgi:Flp pilus assembly pilin Flp